MTQDNIVLTHLRGAVLVWESAGMFAATLWAQRDDDRVLAVPQSQEAARIGRDDQMWMLAWMADCIEATVIGRTDEAWARDVLPTTPTAEALEWPIEDDPSVRTAIVVQSIRLGDGEIVCGIGLPTVNDAGERTWEASLVPMLDPATADVLTMSRQMANQIERDNTSMADRQSLLAHAFHSLGWDLVLC